jgi:glycosyltransferase involved in cell wall biosynthesis
MSETGFQQIRKLPPAHYLVFDQGDAESLSNSVLELLENPTLAKSKGALAREYAVQNFDWTKIAESTEQIYSKMFQESF